MKTALRISSIALALTIMMAHHLIAQPLSGQVCGFPPDTAKTPIIPPILQVPPGNKLSFHVFAKGFQIYRCTADKTDSNRFTWVFVAPAADLYTHPNDRHPIGRHYGGPTWESTDGSKVTGTKLQQADAPDTNAIPWLLLRSASVSGSGIFGKITFIRRTNTKGGKMPPVPADQAHSGQEVRTPYTAEYYFYQPQ
jgi:Protein of unknown function (DUF3455)